MRYLHTMIRVTNLERSMKFYMDGLGFTVVKKNDFEKEKCTLVFLRAPGDGNSGSMIELTYNWGVDQYVRGDAYGHMAFEVDSIEATQERLKEHGYDFSWGPGKTPSGRRQMAFVDDPDGYEIEILETR